MKQSIVVLRKKAYTQVGERKTYTTTSRLSIVVVVTHKRIAVDVVVVKL